MTFQGLAMVSVPASQGNLPFKFIFLNIPYNMQKKEMIE